MPDSTPLTRTRLTGRVATHLARAVWRYRKETLLALLLMLVAKLSIVLIPLVLKHIVDELGRPIAHALFPVFLVLAYALLRLLGDALNEARDVVFSPVAQRTVAAFTERTFAHLHRMSARFHTRRETGAIVRDVQKGADGIGYFVRRRIVHYRADRIGDRCDYRDHGPQLREGIHARDRRHLHVLRGLYLCFYAPAGGLSAHCECA